MSAIPGKTGTAGGLVAAEAAGKDSLDAYLDRISSECWRGKERDHGANLELARRDWAIHHQNHLKQESVKFPWAVEPNVWTISEVERANLSEAVPTIDWAAQDADEPIEIASETLKAAGLAGAVPARLVEPIVKALWRRVEEEAGWRDWWVGVPDYLLPLGTANTKVWYDPVERRPRIENLSFFAVAWDPTARINHRTAEVVVLNHLVNVDRVVDRLSRLADKVEGAAAVRRREDAAATEGAVDLAQKRDAGDAGVAGQNATTDVRTVIVQEVWIALARSIPGLDEAAAGEAAAAPEDRAAAEAPGAPPAAPEGKAAPAAPEGKAAVEELLRSAPPYLENDGVGEPMAPEDRPTLVYTRILGVGTIRKSVRRNGIQVFSAPNFRKPDSAEGIGNVRPIAGMAIAADRIQLRSIEDLYRTMGSILVRIRNSSVAREHLDSRPGGIVEVDSLEEAQALRYLEKNQAGSETTTIRDRLVERMPKALGTGNVSIEHLKSGITASAILEVGKEIEKTDRQKLLNCKPMTEDAARALMREYQQNVVAPVALAVPVGDQVVRIEVPPEVIRALPLHRFTPISSLGRPGPLSTAMKIITLEALDKAGVNDPSKMVSFRISLVDAASPPNAEDLKREIRETDEARVRAGVEQALAQMQGAGGAGPGAGGGRGLVGIPGGAAGGPPPLPSRSRSGGAPPAPPAAGPRP